MMRQVTSINWAYIGDALPAYVTIFAMPFTYSVAYGLIAGLMTYTAVNGAVWITRKVSRGRIEPPDYDNKEYWTPKPTGGSAPWFIRAAHRSYWVHGRVDGESADGSVMDGKEGRVISQEMTG